MSKDPKFGWHTVWLVPLVLFLVMCRWIIDKVHMIKKWFQIQIIYFRFPGIKRMMKIVNYKRK
jgi:hypothetical protein